MERRGANGGAANANAAADGAADANAANGGAADDGEENDGSMTAARADTVRSPPSAR